MEEMKAAPVVKLDTLSDVNDIGKPWRFEEDGLTVTRLSPWSAPGCHPTGCGLKVYTDGEDRVVKVEGDENHPVTQGRLCVRCLTLMDYVYNPSRIIYPMKRDSEKRGDADAWERCTWDEAVAIIKENYDRITKQYGRESCVCFTGTGREGGTFNPYGSVMLARPTIAIRSRAMPATFPVSLLRATSSVRPIPKSITHAPFPDALTTLLTSCPNASSCGARCRCLPTATVSLAMPSLT